MTIRDQAVSPGPKISSLVRKMFEGRSCEVLEAGCGSMTHIQLPDRCHVTGLDISADQLSRNSHVHERIVADLQSVDLEPKYDLTVCWNVLEHLEDPQLALKNMVAGLRQGGVLVIAVPLRSSLKGWVTRLTPHCFHVAFYKWVLKREDAGLPGRQPFRALMRREIGPHQMKKYLEALGVHEIYVCLYQTDHYTHLLTAGGVMSWLIKAAGILTWLVSFGAVSWKWPDVVMVYRKP